MLRLLIYFIAIVLLIAIIFAKPHLLRKTKQSYQNFVTINNKKINIELAKTPTQKARGLMFRKKLNENSGMLFIYSNEAKHAFWMVNTLISLDIIWIDSNHEIVYIQKNAAPCTKDLKSACKTYKPNQKAKYVLEVNSGYTEKSNIKKGDKVKFDIDPNLLK